MKTKKEKYAFSKQEIEILKEIASGNHTLSQIREKLSIKPSLLSYHLKKLQEKRIIKIQQGAFALEGNFANSRKSVLFQDTKHSLILKELLVKYSHIKWENVLSRLGNRCTFSDINWLYQFQGWRVTSHILAIFEESHVSRNSCGQWRESSD